MSYKRPSSSSSSDSAATTEQESSYTSDSSVSKSKTTFNTGVSSSYTRVTRSSRGIFDDHDFTLKKFEDAKDTFTDLEAAYKKFNLRIKSIKEEHKYEVTSVFVLTLFL